MAEDFNLTNFQNALSSFAATPQKSGTTRALKSLAHQQSMEKVQFLDSVFTQAKVLYAEYAGKKEMLDGEELLQLMTLLVLDLPVQVADAVLEQPEDVRAELAHIAIKDIGLHQPPLRPGG